MPLFLGSESAEDRARVPDPYLASVNLLRHGLFTFPGENRESRLETDGCVPAITGATAPLSMGSEGMRALRMVDLKVPPPRIPALPAVVGLMLVPVCDGASLPSLTRMNIESEGGGRTGSRRATMSSIFIRSYALF